MRKYPLILLALCLSLQLAAQKNFQGEITYQLHSSSNPEQDANLKIIFGNNKLKMRFKEKEDYDKADLLVFIDSAVSYTVNSENKTFTRKALQLFSTARATEKKTYFGYSATPYSPEYSPVAGLVGSFSDVTTADFYLADSLFYYIPPTLTGNQELVAIQKNRIVLGMIIQLKSKYADSGTTQAEQLVTAEAIEIKPYIPAESEFIIPADYKDGREAIMSPVTDTATTVVVDTAYRYTPPVKKGAPKKAAKPKSGGSKPKTQAIKRKE